MSFIISIGKSRIRFLGYLHDRVRNENHRLRIRCSQRGLPSQFVELARFHNRRYRVS